jgi:tetratricopeptide (TPR) repeat protein
MALSLFNIVAPAVWGRWSGYELAQPPDDRDGENLLARTEALTGANRREDAPRVLRMVEQTRAALPPASRLLQKLDVDTCDYFLGLIQAGRETSPTERARWGATALDFGLQAEILNPATTSPHTCRAEAYAALERWDEGEAEARYVINTAPLTAGGYEALADIELGEGRFRDALAAFRELAQRADGSLPEIGLTHLMLGEVDDAISSLREAAIADPSDPVAPFYLAAAYQLSGRHADAVMVAQTYLRLKSDDGAWHELSLSHSPAFAAAASRVREGLLGAGLEEPGARASQ